MQWKIDEGSWVRKDGVSATDEEGIFENNSQTDEKLLNPGNGKSTENEVQAAKLKIIKSFYSEKIYIKKKAQDQGLDTRKQL